MLDLDCDLHLTRAVEAWYGQEPDGECPHCGRDAFRAEYEPTGRCMVCRIHRAAKFADRLTWNRRRVRNDRRTLRMATLWIELAGKRNRAMSAREKITNKKRIP